MVFRIAVAVSAMFAVSNLSAFAQQPKTKLKCSAPSAVATYSPARPSVPPMVDLTFRGRRPTSALAEKQLRTCVQEVLNTMFVQQEILANAWFGTSDADDELVPLVDGSKHIVADPKTKTIRTELERAGTRRETQQKQGYRSEREQQRILVPPGGTFESVTVVFPQAPTEKRAYEAAISEALQWIATTKHSEDVTVYVNVGGSDPAGRKPMLGADRRPIWVAFEKKRPNRLFGSSGQDLGIAVPAVK
jgi:hypothetical protein